MKRMAYYAIFLGLLLCSAAARAQHVDTALIVFHVNKTPIWSYGFLRSTTKEFLETAKGLEQNLLGFKDRLQSQQEKDLLLRQALEMSVINQNIANLGVNYALQAKNISIKNADVANLRRSNKEAQINEGVAAMEFKKKKNEEIKRASFWSNLLNAGVSIAAGALSGGASSAFSAGGSFGKGVISGSLQGSGQTGLGGLIFGGQIQDAQNAIQQRQEEDQIAQMRREEQELLKLSDIAQDQVVQEENSWQIALANASKASVEVRQAQDRINLFSGSQPIPNDKLQSIIAAIEQIRTKYIDYAVVLAKLTEKAYQAEEVVSSNLIKRRDDYTAGNTGTWLASDKILLDLNTIEFNRITQKKQKPNFSTYTVSLNNKDPFQLELLRQRGIMNFDITQFEIDLAFPGTYAQTIKEIDVQVLALADPDGIKGQLTKEGLSWKKVPSGIVDGNPYVINDWFSYVPSGYKGMVFDDQDETLILPKLKGATQEPGLKGIFEGKPVCGIYTLELPKYSNSFDYNTIADVIITIQFASYFDPVLKQMVETEICEQDRAQSYVNKRIMAVSMADMEPDEWYEFMNPDERDTLAQTRRYLPFYVRRGYFPTNQLNRQLNGLSVSFLKEGRYVPVKFSVTSAAMNPGKKLESTHGIIDPLRLDTLRLDTTFRYFHPLTGTTVLDDATINDTVYVQIADSLMLSKQKTDMLNDSRRPYELWLIRLDATDNPAFCQKNRPGVFDQDSLKMLNDIIMEFGYQFSLDFCQTNSRVYAYMDVEDDTTKIRAIDASQREAVYLKVQEAGVFKKRTQDRLAWYEWNANLTQKSFELKEVIHKDQYADLVPFYSFLHAKTPIEEIEVKLDLTDQTRGTNEVTIYCSPSWITMKIYKISRDELALQFEVDLNQRDQFKGDSIYLLKKQATEIQLPPVSIPLSGVTLQSPVSVIRNAPRLSTLNLTSPSTPYVATPATGATKSDIYTFKNHPIHLIFRYLNLADNSGRATVDITILEYESRTGNPIYSRLFNKAPVFYRWRNDLETNFALRIHQGDFENTSKTPGIVIRDLKFSDFARF